MESRSEPKSSLFSGLVWLVFLLLVVSLGFMQPFIYIALQRLSPTDFIFPVLVILSLVAILLRQLLPKWHAAYWYLGAYFAAMAISSVFSVYPPTSYIKLLGEAYLIGLAVLTINLVDTPIRTKHVVFAWLVGTIGSIAVAILTVILYYFQPDNWLLAHTTYHFGAVPVVNFPRVSSTFVSASMFCNYLNVGVVLAFVAKEKDWIGAKAFLTLLILIILAAFSTISIGIGGVILAIAICFWLTKRADRRAAAKISLLVGIMVAAAFYASSFVALQPHATAFYTINLPFTQTVLYPSPRLLVWSETLKTFAADPVTGKGLNQPVCAVPFQNTDGSYSMLTDAHNIYLSVAAQNGIIGFMALLGLAIYILRIGYRGTDIVTRLLTAAFLTAFVYQGLTGAYEDARHLWVLIGLLIAASKLGSGPE